MKFKIYYNAKLNHGSAVLQLLHIKVFSYNFNINKGYIKFYNKRKKFYVPLDFQDESVKDYTEFQSIMFKKIYVKKISAYFNIGLKNNAFFTAMSTAVFEILANCICAVLKEVKKEVVIKNKIYPSFNKDVIKIGFKVKISLSLYDVLWSFIEACITKQIKSHKQGVLKWQTKNHIQFKV